MGVRAIVFDPLLVGENRNISDAQTGTAGSCAVREEEDDRDFGFRYKFDFEACMDPQHHRNRTAQF